MTETSAITFCQTCHGRGRIQDQKGTLVSCPACQEMGAVTWWAGSWWGWQRPLTLASLHERRFEHVVKILVSGFFFLLTGIGLWLSLPSLYQSAIDGELLVTFMARNLAMASFWVAILSAMYLVYRLEREVMMLPSIPAAEDVAAPATEPFGKSSDISDISEVMTEASQRLIEHAWRLARQVHHQEVTPGHMVLMLLTVPEVASMIVRMGLDPKQVRDRLTAWVSSAPTGSEDPVLDHASREALLRSFRLATEQHRPRITPALLMASFAAVESPVRDLLDEMGVDDNKLKHVMAWLVIQDELRFRVRSYQLRALRKPKGVVDRAYTAVATPVLDHYGVDLTLQARAGQFPYILGREDVVTNVLRVMESGRRSVVLVSDVGVGKTTVLQSLAERMVAEDVPEILQDKRLVSLSASAVVAGAGAIGQLEERMQTVIHEVLRAGNVVLAIENFDQLVGVSSTGGQGLDLAQNIAQAVTQQGLLVIATSETSAYRETMESGSLVSAFEKVSIPEMDPEQAIVAIESRIGMYERRHNVFYTYDAISQAVMLSHRYLHEKTLPGVALGVLEEAAVLAKRQRGKNALVLGEDVATILGQQTNVAVSNVTAAEQTKLLNLEEELHRRVIGQDEAVNAVANALRRARAEIRDTRRPIANLMFLGPTGVGKTELAKTVAAVYFGSEDAMIRLDMSEYQDTASINRLVGAPPGYSDAGSGGMLTEAVRRKPFSLVLLDELEKAHPDVLNIFLQVMDDGRLTDNSGRTIDFTNVIIIATSNAGSQHIQDRMRDGAAVETIKSELLNQELQKYFRPEFLNRFDSIVVFTPLDRRQVEQIVTLMIASISEQLAKRGISFTASPGAISELAATGFDPAFGARPLRRAVQEKVDNALATFMLQGKLGRRDVAVLEEGGQIRVDKAARVGE